MIIKIKTINFEYLLDLDLIYSIGGIRQNLDVHEFYISPINEKLPICISSRQHKHFLEEDYVDTTGKVKQYDVNYLESAEYNEVLKELINFREKILDEWLISKNQSTIKTIDYEKE